MTQLLRAHLPSDDVKVPLLGSREEVEKTLGIGVHHKRRWPLYALLGALALGIAVFLVVRWVAARQAASIPAYETVAVVRADLSVTVTATGTLQGLSTVEVGAEVSGKVIRVLVDYNDTVEVGQIMALIDPEQSQAAFDQSTASVAAANASTRLSEATVRESAAAYTRAKSQAEAGITATKDVEAAKATWERAKASLAASVANATVARAVLDSATSKLTKTTIVSPVKGTVLARLIEPGQTVTAGFTTPLLFKVTEDLRQMRLEVYVDEADIGRVKEGQDATFAVDAYPEKTFSSKVTTILNEPTTEQNVVSYTARLTADNSALLLRPGMTATATITADRRAQALLVPNAALRFAPPVETASFGPGHGATTTAATPHVYVLEAGALRLVEVRPGASDGASTEILEGTLEAGALVVVDVKDPE